MVGLALVLTVLCADDDLTPEKAAKISRERDKAMADVAKKYGNKKSSELSPDERREMIRDQREAETHVLDQNKVDAKEFARYEARMNLADRAATRAERERLDKKEAADKAAAEKPEPPPHEVQVQRGFSDEHPVMLEEKPGAAPVVEKGLPPDALDDQAAAAGSKEVGTPEPAPAPKKGKGKK